MKTKLLSLMFALIATFTLNAQTWTMVGDPPMNSIIQTIAVDSGNKMYVAGVFSYGPVSTGKTFVAKWDFVDWADVGNFNGNGSIDKMVISGDNKIYIMGGFKNPAGKYYIATYNGTSWVALGSLVSSNPIVDMVIDGNTIYIAGNFTSTVDGQTYYISKWDGTSWSQVDTGVFNGTVNSLSIDKDHNLNAGGNFKNNFGFYCIYKLSGSSWTEVGKLKSSYAIEKILCDKLGKVYAQHAYNGPGGLAAVLSRYKLEDNTWSVLDLTGYTLLYVDRVNNVYASNYQTNYKVFSPNLSSGEVKNVYFPYPGSVNAISMDKFGYPLLGSFKSAQNASTYGVLKSSEAVGLSTNNDELKNSGIIFPNPSTGIFKVQSGENIDSIGIFDATGKLIKQILTKSKETEINLTGSPKGVYFIKIGSGKNQTSQKLILK